MLPPNLRKSMEIEEFNLLFLAAVGPKFWPWGKTWTTESEGTALSERRGLTRETAGGMKRKQKVGARKTKWEKGLEIEGGLCNSFIELITWVRYQWWPEATVRPADRMPKPAFYGLWSQAAGKPAQSHERKDDFNWVIGLQSEGGGESSFNLIKR